MRTISRAWRRAYNAGNRNYIVVLNVELADGTTFTVTNDQIWEGGFSIEEGTSDENSFSIGSAVIGKCTVVLDNTSEVFSGYDFFNAEFNAYLNLEGLTEQNLLLGHYTVDETSYNGSLITLTALDNMWRFDTPFADVGYTFTQFTTARDVVVAMCQYAGIGIQLATLTFQGYDFPLAEPEQELNCREVLQYIAQATCNVCKINEFGNLELFWYDKAAINSIRDYDGGTFLTTTTPYSDGDELDGGTFNPWNDGDEADGGLFYDDTSTMGYITDNYSMEVGTDGIVVTGVKICSSNQDNDDAYDYSWHDSTLEQDYPRYTLVIQDNVFINKDNASERTTTIGAILADLPLRSFTASATSDISIEAGDPVAINDFRGNRFYSFVTNVRFQTNNPESFSCGVESLTQNKTIRYSNEIKTLVEAQRNAQEILSAYDQAVKQMNDLAQAAYAYREYTYTTGGSKIMYRYSGTYVDTNPPASAGNPKFPDSDIVWKIASNGVWIATEKDSQGFPLYSNGYDANTGTALLSMIYTVGLNADWINAGHISCDRLSGGTITGQSSSGGTIYGTSISGQTISGGTISGSAISGGSISGGAISGGSVSGSSISGGSISGSNITSTSTGGGSTNINGGMVTINTKSDCFFQVQYVVNNQTRRITFGEEISIRDETHGIQASFSYRDFYNALHQTAQDEH